MVREQAAKFKVMPRELRRNNLSFLVAAQPRLPQETRVQQIFGLSDLSSMFAIHVQF